MSKYNWPLMRAIGILGLLWGLVVIVAFGYLCGWEAMGWFLVPYVCAGGGAWVLATENRIEDRDHWVEDLRKSRAESHSLRHELCRRNLLGEDLESALKTWFDQVVATDLSQPASSRYLIAQVELMKAGKAWVERQSARPASP